MGKRENLKSRILVRIVTPKVMPLKPIIRDEKDLVEDESGPFPAKILLSSRDTRIASVKVGVLEKGKTIEVHSHEGSDQIEYYMDGKAVMYIEGLGERIIHKGSFTYIPKGVKHGIKEVIEPLKIITIFIPPLF